MHMIRIETAQALRAAGVRWVPESGDRFVIDGVDRGDGVKGVDPEVFVVSNMTVDVHHFPSGPVIGFNGTTEWALDSIEQSQALWLPRESQLRALLGRAFLRLSIDEGTKAFVVDFRASGEYYRQAAMDAEQAYALALLDLISFARD